MEANMNQMIEQIVKEVVRQIGGQPGGCDQPAHAELAKYIDHTVLYAYTTRETIARFCDEAMKYHFAAVCFNPIHVAFAKQRLAGSNVKVATVIGFPLGANTPVVKAFETKDAIANGVDEVDMVINIGAAKEHNWDLVREDMKAVIDAARESSRYIKVKVIIETCLLTDEEKVKVCEIARELQADFVKTSSGFSTGGATAEDVALMKRTVGPTIEVKASTGVRTTEAVQKMVANGATRIGTGSGIKIVTGGDDCKNCPTCTNCRKS